MMAPLDVAQLFGSSDGRFERVFSALAAGENTKLEGMQKNLALLSGEKDAVAILRYTGDHPTIARQLEELTKIAQQHPLEVAMIGGPLDARSLLENARALASTKHPIRAYHLPDASAELWQSTRGEASPLAKILRAAAEDRLPAPDWPKVQLALEKARASQNEVAEFATALQSRRPYVTYALLAMIGAMFLLEMSVDKAFSAQTMLALGAIHGDLVKSGEYYRLISAGFLHFGPVHLLMNSLVLWRLGGTFERLIGPYRFLILYALALLGGSFGALIFQGNAVSAGASGALWGILGAEAVLAFRPAGVIPASVAQGLKKSAMQNLVLNVVISLTPGIGWAAHFGGGIIGALLTVSGAITAGVKQRRTPIVLKLIGGVCAALMIAGVVIAVSSSGRADLFTKP